MTDERSGNPEVGRRLALARERAGLTQRDVMERFGRPRENNSWLSNKETGRRAVNQDELREFARLYGVSVDELLGLPKREEPQDALSRLGQVISGLVAIPVYDLEAHAGFASGSILDYSYREVPATAVSKNLKGVRVRGDCLVPDVMDGYLIIIDTERTAKPGDFIVVSDSEETHVARLEIRRGKPVAVNNEGLLDLDAVRIAGVVIQISRDL